MPQLQIREAEITDVPFILQCIRGLAQYVGELASVTADEPALEKALFDPGAGLIVFIASHGRESAGYIILFKTFSTFKAKFGLFIEDLYILPQYRNQGFGTQLLGFVKAYAREYGYHKIEWYVNNKNENALEFYQKTGASKLDYKSIFYQYV